MVVQSAWSKQKPEWIVLSFTILALLLLPSRARQEIVRFHQQALVIQTSKTSPPRLAFHETIDRSFGLESWFEDAATKTTRVDLNQTVAGNSAIHGVKAIRYKKMVLNAMQVPRETALKILDDQSWVDKLPANQRERVALAQQSARVLDSDWKIPTTKDLFAEKIREINSQTTVTTPSGITISATDENGNQRTRQPEGGVEVRRDSPESDSGSGAERGPSKNVISGPLRLNGAELGPGRHIEVHWLDRGVKQGTGHVDENPNNFQYAIEIPERSGSVVAMLMDQNGSEIGRGSLRISALDSADKLRNAEISIRPRNEILRKAHNFYDQGSAQLMSVSRARRNPPVDILVSATAEETKTDDDGVLHVDGIAEGSWSFLRTDKKGFYPGLYLATAGDEKALPLFPEKMMKALLQIVRETRGSGLGGENGAIIWGQVTAKDGGTAGVRVELEDLPEAQPVYFNDLLIPDDKATQTGTNGYFAFVDLPRGFYSIRALRGDRQLGIANVEVDDGTVSPAQIATDLLKEKVPVEVFDAFTGSPQIARAEFQHLDQPLDITGFAPVEIPQDDILSLVKVTPQDPAYQESIQVFSAKQDHLHLPLIRSDWLASIKGTLRLTDITETGTILGFVPGADYELSLPHFPEDRLPTIFYFDAQGMPAQSGVAGGGFIVFNAPTGSHSITVLPKTGNVVHSRILPVDAGTLNVLKFDF